MRLPNVRWNGNQMASTSKEIRRHGSKKKRKDDDQVQVLKHYDTL